MARGVNKVILVGNTTSDPEVRYQTNGNAVTNITVATNESWKDKNTGQMQERAEFHRIVFFNKLAEIAGEYLRKGSKVYVEGALRTRKWQDQSGQDRYTTEIVASEMQMLDSRSENGGAPQQSPQQNYQQPPQPPQQAPQQQRPAPQHQRSPNEGVPHASEYQAGGNAPAPEWDSDIPFMNPYKFYEMIV